MSNLYDMPADKAAWPEVLGELLKRQKAVFGADTHPWPCTMNGAMGACMACRNAAAVVARVQGEWQSEYSKANKLDPKILAAFDLDLSALPPDVTLTIVVAPHGKSFKRPKRGNATLAFGDRVLIRASKARAPRKRKSPEERLRDVIVMK